MTTVARGAWVKWARSAPEAGIGASVPTARVSPSRTSRAMAHAINSSGVWRAALSVDVPVEVALEGGVVRGGGDIFLDVPRVGGVHAPHQRGPGAARRLDERAHVDARKEHAVAR